jgi:hypothetical protein
MSFAFNAFLAGWALLNAALAGVRWAVRFGEFRPAEFFCARKNYHRVVALVVCFALITVLASCCGAFEREPGGDWAAAGAIAPADAESGVVVEWFRRWEVSYDNAPVWDKNYGGLPSERPSSVAPTFGGGYVVAGEFCADDFSAGDGWVAKLSPVGEIVWRRHFGGSDADSFNSIQQTSDGGYIAAGVSRSTDGGASASGGERYSRGPDFWVVRMDLFGSVIWNRRFGGSDDDVARSVAQTPDGGFIVAGCAASRDGDVKGRGPLSSGYDAWVIKLDAAGRIVWQRSLGGAENDAAESVSPTLDGGYIVAGWTFSGDGGKSGAHGGDDFWVVKLDASGGVVWNRRVGGPARESASSALPTSDGGCFAVGSNDSRYEGETDGATDLWAVKLDADGRVEWDRIIGGVRGEAPKSARQTSDGGYVVAATARGDDAPDHRGRGDIWVVRLDRSGGILWQKQAGGTGDDTAGGVLQTFDGGYVVVGATDSDDGDFPRPAGDSRALGSLDFLVIKLSPVFGGAPARQDDVE